MGPVTLRKVFSAAGPDSLPSFVEALADLDQHSEEQKEEEMD